MQSEILDENSFCIIHINSTIKWNTLVWCVLESPARRSTFDCTKMISWQHIVSSKIEVFDKHDMVWAKGKQDELQQRPPNMFLCIFLKLTHVITRVDKLMRSKVTSVTLSPKAKIPSPLKKKPTVSESPETLIGKIWRLIYLKVSLYLVNQIRECMSPGPGAAARSQSGWTDGTRLGVGVVTALIKKKKKKAPLTSSSNGFFY